MKWNRLPWVGVLLGACLAGCSGLRSEAEPDHLYVLQAAPAAVAGQPVAAVLLVSRPVVTPGLDTDRIALLRAGNELDYYAASRWGDALPKVLGVLAQQSMAGADGFSTVIGADRAGVASDFELLLTVRRFQAEYAGDAALPSAQVAIDCVLVAGTPRRVLGHCDGVATEAVAEVRMGEIVRALERAAQRALAQVRAKAVALARGAPGR